MEKSTCTYRHKSVYLSPEVRVLIPISTCTSPTPSQREGSKVRIVNAADALVSTYTIQPGETVQTPTAPGI